MITFRVAILFALLVTSVFANIQLVGNGYEGVVVSIGADVDVDPDLLTTLEGILTAGSATLFKATKNQVHFKEFIIVLPENWPRLDHYQNALDLELDEPDVLIDIPNESLGDRPYVLQYGGCGRGGIFMHLTPDYILKDTVRSRYGKPGTTFTHEWAHLRYGVFDEYPTAREEKFYRIGNLFHPTRCTLEVTGVLANRETFQSCQIDVLTGTPEETCEFFPNPNGPAVASIMFDNTLENMEEFCDKATTAPNHLRHNRLPNNRQNRLCSYMSTWEVMRSHPDFISLSNQSALPNDTDTQPRFRYVQANSRKRVLVLDRSGSMAGDPLIGLQLAAGSFILSSVETGSHMGIVSFNALASVISPLLQIVSDDDRERLVNALPNDASGGTSIGAGLLSGLQALSGTNSNRNSSGGTLILITDGIENRHPFIDDVIPAILEAGVVVHSLSYGQKADPKIANLSQLTGGDAAFFTGNQNSTGLLDGLANTVNAGRSLVSKSNVSISILTEGVIVSLDNPVTGTFFIDSTIGKGTTLTFSYTQHIQVEIASPHGPYNATDVKEFSSRGSTAKVLRVTLEDDLPPGQWSYTVTTVYSQISVLINIQSKPRHEGQKVIQVQSWLSQKDDIVFSSASVLGVYAEVLRGRTPVVDANAVATVETTSSTFDLVLLDNGKVADIIEGDGIYSGNIIATDFSGDGRYNIKIKVLGTEERTKVFIAGTGSASNAAELRTPGVDGSSRKEEPLEDFQREATAGEFRLIGYTPLVEDSIPPARIVDLNVKSYSSNEHEVVLTWTAVGSDMDRGQADSYRIYKSLDADDIISTLSSASNVTQGHVTRGNLSRPDLAGEVEEFVVYLEELDANVTETVYMSVSAVDEAGNEGQASNMVTVSDAREVVVRNLESSDSDSKDFMYLAVAGPVAFVFIVTIVVAIVILRFKSTKKKSSPQGLTA